jgi:hypothetical protein
MHANYEQHCNGAYLHCVLARDSHMWGYALDGRLMLTLTVSSTVTLTGGAMRLTAV